MKHSIIKTALIALALGMCASLTLAEGTQPQKAKQTNAAGNVKAPATKSKAGAPKVNLVDINSATRSELKKLPGGSDAEADKIIAGRPYLSKAHLVTHKIISAARYQDLRQLIVARQKDAKFGKDPKTK